jgi:cytochrome c-type biogenesis protein CcmH
MNRFFSKFTAIIHLTCKKQLASCFLLLATCYLLLTTPAYAQTPDSDRVNEIAKKLNCPTCSGLNLADCRTQTCAQWRDQIGELVTQGYTDQEIIDYFSTRYGDQVLQEPPRRGFSLALWVLPVLALLGGVIWVGFMLRRWSKPQPVSPAQPAPDTDDEYLRQVEQDLGD